MTASELGFITLTTTNRVLTYVRCSSIQTIRRTGEGTYISLGDMDHSRLVVRETPEEIFEKFV